MYLLYAEDEEELRELTTEMLQERGFRVIAAADGQEALDIYKGQPDKIGIVLTDVVMPKMTGKALFDTIRELDAEMGFIFISGYSRKQLSKDEGALPSRTKFLSKPVDFEEVVKAIKELMKKPVADESPSS